MEPDPFSERRHVANSAINDRHLLPPDLYQNLFGKAFFQSQIYRVWSQGSRSWSLHCYGDPGCGKVRWIIPPLEQFSSSLDRLLLPL